MASIIRAPEISEEKRKLASRNSSPTEQLVVKAAQLAPAPAAVELQAAEDARQLAARELEQQLAQARAAVREELRQEADAAREAAREQGLLEGRQSAAVEASKQAAAQLAKVSAVTAQVQAAVAAGIGGIEDIAVAIAYEAVCKILGDGAVTLPMIQAAVNRAACHAIKAERVVIRLHPADLATLRDAGALDPVLPSGAAASWSADQTITLGGCVIETEDGELDARLDTQMERLRAALLAARAAPPDAG